LKRFVLIEIGRKIIMGESRNLRAAVAQLFYSTYNHANSPLLIVAGTAFEKKETKFN
jgi:hypothetical protein